MKIDFEHLGGIEKGSIELNDFTLFCGKNNSGKTYVMYSIYGLFAGRFNINFTLNFVKPIVDKLKEDGTYCINIAEILANHKTEMIDNIESDFNKNLPNLFGVSNDYFLNLKTHLKFFFSDKELLEKIKIDDVFGDNINYSRSSGEHGSENLWTWRVDKDEGKIYLTLHNNEIVDGSLQYKISKYLIWTIFSGWLFSYNDLNRQSFLLPAERAGINLFYKELFSIRNLLLQQAQNDNINPMYLLKDIVGARYAEPVKDYLQFLNNISDIKKYKSDYCEYAKLIQNDVLNGEYEVDDFGNVSFLLSNSNNKLPLHFASSTVKTLFGLVFYLKHVAKEGDYLMVDEPELNLHPDNQRQVARILAQLVNAGLKVVVSTHSNYFVREINNLIMLKNEFKGVAKLRKKYKYQTNELIDSKRISAYLFDNNTIYPMKIDEEGIIAETFDEVTDALNQSSDDIYYTMQDAKS